MASKTRWRRIALGVAAVLAVLAAAVWYKFESIVMAVPRLAMALKDPIGPYREVAWQQGPAAAEVPPQRRPPNVVFILVDDLGWNGVSRNGKGIAGGAVPTPNIDSIAAAGVQFTNGYAPNAICSPSRAALMTGRYATRFGFEYTPTPDGMAPIVKYLYRRDPHFTRPPLRFSTAGKAPSFEDMGMPASE